MAFRSANINMLKYVVWEVFNLRPPKVKYSVTWDVGKVILYLKTHFPAELLSLKTLTLKLAMLIALMNANRA